MKCPGSGAYPTNFDGELTRCDQCGRSLTLTRGGLVPGHSTERPGAKLLPRGEAVVDGRRTG